MLTRQIEVSDTGQQAKRYSPRQATARGDVSRMGPRPVRFVELSPKGKVHCAVIPNRGEAGAFNGVHGRESPGKSRLSIAGSGGGGKDKVRRSGPNYTRTNMRFRLGPTGTPRVGATKPSAKPFVAPRSTAGFARFRPRVTQTLDHAVKAREIAECACAVSLRAGGKPFYRAGRKTYQKTGRFTPDR